jgi:DNA-binding GntR family transcriptional regulator
MVKIDDWPRIDGGGTLTEQVYQALRRRLGDGGVAPGTFLREPELSEAMGVSRTPIREALSRLVSEGFVERIPHRGFRTPEHSIDTLVHLYPVLVALEVLAGELAFPRLSEEDLREVDEANDRFAAAVDAQDIPGAVEWNEEFHRRIARRSGNPVLSEILDDLRTQVRRLEMWDFGHLLGGTGRKPAAVSIDELPRQHQRILAAVRAGDFEGARALLRVNRSLHFAMERERPWERGRSIDDPEGRQPIRTPT